MPLFLERTLSPDTRLAVWQIAEAENWYLERLMLDDTERELIASIKHPQRRLHWLSSRWLIRHLLNNPPRHIALRTDERGKPFILNFPVHISISHTADMSALLLSHSAAVGVDMERCSGKIFRIRNKFLSQEELGQLHQPDDVCELYAYWCAKETLYKLYGRRELDFRRHLYIEPFELDASTCITGHIRKPPVSSSHQIMIERFGPYVLAFAAGSLPQNHRTAL